MRIPVFFKQACAGFALMTVTLGAYAQDNSQVTLLKHMFRYMVEKKNIQVMPAYYSKAFVLESNNRRMGYAAYYRLHQKNYQTSMRYQVRYDNTSWVTQGNQTAGRIFIDIKEPKQAWKHFQVIMIVRFKHGKIAKITEVTYPGWSGAFKHASSHTHG